MKLGTWAAAAVVVGSSLAAHANGMTEAEAARLAHFRQEPRLVACMAEFKFDFFSNQLGFSIDGQQASELEQLQQFRTFLNTGKLEQTNPKAKVSKDLTKHCTIVAQTVAEMIALKLAGQQAEDPQDSKDNSQTN